MMSGRAGRAEATSGTAGLTTKKDTDMTPLMISIIVFLAVTGLIGFIALRFPDTSPQTTTRPEILGGKKERGEQQTADILKKTDFESDKKSFLETITPNLPKINMLFELADCHIKPSTLFGIGIGLALLGITFSWLAGVPWFFTPFAGAVLFVIPYLWLLWKRK